MGQLVRSEHLHRLDALHSDLQMLQVRDDLDGQNVIGGFESFGDDVRREDVLDSQVDFGRMRRPLLAVDIASIRALKI